MHFVDVLGVDGNVCAQWVECSLCEKLRLPSEMDVFEGPGQAVPCCIHCLVDFETWCEGRALDDAPADEAEAA